MAYETTWEPAPPRNKLAVAAGFEPAHGRINSALPYRLGYATIVHAQRVRRLLGFHIGRDGWTRTSDSRLPTPVGLPLPHIPKLVEQGGFEPPASCFQSRHAGQAASLLETLCASHS